MKKILKYIAVCFSLFFISFLSTACGNSLDGIRLTCPSLRELGTSYYAAYVGQSFAVNVETAPSDFDLTDKLLWSSDNTSVAVVENGTVTPKSTGRANILAKFKDNENIYAGFSIRVYAESSEELSFTSEMYYGIYGDDLYIDINQDYDDVIFEFSGTLKNGTVYPAEMKNTQPKEAGIYVVTTTYGDYAAQADIVIDKRTLQVPIGDYKKVYGANTVMTKEGAMSDDFAKNGNDYLVELPNGDKDTIVYKLKCDAVDVTTPENTTYVNVGDYPVTLEIDVDASPKFANNYNLTASTNGTLTVEPLAVTLVAKDKVDTYGSNASFLNSANFALYRTAEYKLTDPDKLNEITNLASSEFNGIFANQISFSTSIYKNGNPYTEKRNIGDYDLICSASQVKPQNGKVNLVLTSDDIVNAKYTITPRPLTVFPTANQSKFAGEQDPTLTYSTNSNGIVDGDVLLPLLTRIGGNIPGDYSFDLITYGDPNNFVINDNYNITIDGTNMFKVKENTVNFILKGQILDYGQALQDFDYEVYFNGNLIENPVIDNDGFITLQSYTINEGEENEESFENKIKPTITVDSTAEVDDAGYYRRYRLNLDYAFANTNEGYNKEDEGDLFYIVSYNNLTPALICYNKIDLIIKPYSINSELTTKVYDNDNDTDEEIHEATCEGYILGDASFSDVFDAVLFKKQDLSTDVGSYPFVLINYNLKTGKDFYNVIVSEEVLNYTITPRELVISPLKDQTKLYGSADKEFKYTITNLASGDKDEDIVYSIALSREVGEKIGAYSYVLKGFTCSPNYTYSFNTLLADGSTENTYTITQRTLNISAVSQTVIYGDEIPDLTYVVSVAASTEDVFLSSYKPTFVGKIETTAQKFSVVGDYSITQGSLDAGENFNIVFTEGKVSILKKSATFSVLAGEVSSGTTPDVSTIKYSFAGLLTDTTPDVQFNILPDNATTPTKYALSGEAYGKNNTSSSLTFNYVGADSTVYNQLKLMFGGEDVVDCYDITIETTTAFYVASLVLNISIVDMNNLSSSIIETTYDETSKTGLFTIVGDDSDYIITPADPITGYVFNYKKPGETQILPAAPVNAGTYTVEIDTNSIKVTKQSTGEDVTPTLNIAVYGSLIINKANLYYKTDADKPGIRPMEYGSTVLPTELVGKKISSDPLEYEAVKIYTDPECTVEFGKGVKATYNTAVYTESYIASLTVLGSPYTISMMITPSIEADRANYNSVSINFDLIITARQMDVTGATFAYVSGIKDATYTTKVINNTLKINTNEEYVDKIGVSYSFVGVNYNSSSKEHYGLLAYYEDPIYIGDTANIKYISRNELDGAKFTFNTTDNYILANKGTSNYYLQLTHLSGVPINAGIYFVVANIRSTDGNYALSKSADTEYKTLFEVKRSEEFEINNWQDEFMYGISKTEILDKFSFTTNPSRVKAYCTIIYELGADIATVDGSDIIAICAEDQSYKVKVVISSPNYYQEKDLTFKIIQLDAVIGFPALDKYQYTGHVVSSFIQNTKVTLYALDGTTSIVVYDYFSAIGEWGVAPMQIKYFKASDTNNDGIPDTVGEEVVDGPVEVGFYLITCVYNDRTYFGEGEAFFEITKTYYTGSISLENGSFAYDPFLSLETNGATGKIGLYDWIFNNMIKIPADEMSRSHYKKYDYANGDPTKAIQLSVVMAGGEELEIGGANGIKNCGTYTIKLILSFNDGITQTTSSEAILTINKVALNSDAFSQTAEAEYVYSGYDKYHEVKYTGATVDPITVSVTGYDTFKASQGDVTGWYGYFNKDASNFCVIYNYYKDVEGSWVALPEKRAPIVPGKYKSVCSIIPGNNYLLQNTQIQDSVFYVTTTSFKNTQSSGIYEVYNGSDQSTNSNLKLTILNDATAEIKITYVYYFEGKYYDYNGGEISLDPAKYDETKGLIFEKYFYKYTKFGATASEKELDTTKKLIKDDIKNAGNYEVYYSLLYPNSSNQYDFFVSGRDFYADFSNAETNSLNRTITIEKAPFSNISNTLNSKELGVYVMNSSNVKQEYNGTPLIAVGSADDSFSSKDNPLVTVTYGQVKISIEGTEKANLSLQVFNESDSTPVSFTKVGDVYTSQETLSVGSYYFILSHTHDLIVNYYMSAPCHFKVVKAKVVLETMCDNMTAIEGSDDLEITGTGLKFNFLGTTPTVTMEYNKTEDFEDLVVMYKWLKAGSLTNPEFVVSYFTDVECSSPKSGALEDFSHGTYYALININSTEYSVEKPLVVKVVIAKTSDYEIAVTNASFVYQDYQGTSLAITAKYNSEALYGAQIFFSDSGELTSEHIAIMDAFADANREDGYILRTMSEVTSSAVGSYNAIGIFIPANDSYLPKAFGYRYTVTAQPLKKEQIESIELLTPFTAQAIYNKTQGIWEFASLTISANNNYPARIVLQDGTILDNDKTISITAQMQLSASVLTLYFADPASFKWSTVANAARLEFQTGDYSFSDYISTFEDILTITIVKPSLSSIVTQISSVNTTYTGSAYSLNIETLNYSFATVKDTAGNVVTPQPLTSFTDILSVVYGTGVSNVATLVSPDLTYASSGEYLYTITTVAPGEYSLLITFAESTCFAETDYNVIFRINKIQAGSLGQVVYEYESGKYISFTNSLIFDAFGLIAGDENAVFYGYDTTDSSTPVLIGTEFNNANFKLLINGEYRSIADATYAASITFTVNSMGPYDSLTSDGYWDTLNVDVSITFADASVVEGEFTFSFTAELYVTAA